MPAAGEDLSTEGSFNFNATVSLSKTGYRLLTASVFHWRQQIPHKIRAFLMASVESLLKRATFSGQ